MTRSLPLVQHRYPRVSKRHIAPMDYPVARVHVVAAGGHLDHRRAVGVPGGHDVQGIVVRELFGCPRCQERQSPLRLRRRAGSRGPVRARYAFGQPDAQVGVKPAEEPASEAASQQEAHAAVSRIPGTQSIAVSEKHGLALEPGPERLLLKVESDAVTQEASAPPVVIAAQEKHGYSGFHEVG